MALYALLALVGSNAIIAGLLLVLGPDGHFLRLPPEDLRGSPFPDFLVPGLALAGLGGLHVWAFYAEVARSPRAWFWAGLAGAGLCVWIAVQVLVIQPSPLQPALFAVGAAEGLLALAQRRLGPEPDVEFAEGDDEAAVPEG
jgi:hypothetical protein